MSQTPSGPIRPGVFTEPDSAESEATFFSTPTPLTSDSSAAAPFTSVRNVHVETAAPTLSVTDEKSPLAPPGELPTPAGFEILGELGRGGMGVVYRARQTSLNRIVALKMILSGTHASSLDLSRFRGEAEAAARLRHPNIIQIYEVGEVSGQPYIALEFAEGGPLSQRLRGTPLPAREAAQLVADLAQAIHAAHQEGILHRDLKPANILLSPRATIPEAPARSADSWALADVGFFEPKITDFGLAKHFRETDSAVREETQTGMILGTPSYMAPEQAAGKTKHLGPAADIYALGAILYELLTGRPPFRADTPLDTVRQVLERDPAPPRLLNPKVDRDLETICLKCLEKDPPLRYASAQALADDLQHHLNGESISARSFNLLDRLTRTLDRSQNDVAFRGWGTMLLLCAATVLVCHSATFAVVQSGLPLWLARLTRGVEFVVIALIFWRMRPRTLLPTSATERQLWSIWLGYFASFGALSLIMHLMLAFGWLVQGPNSVRGWQVLLMYPPCAVLSGLALFVMGSNYWGRCYALGAGFLVLAMLMPLKLDWAPLAFGVLWSGTLAAIGLHLRYLSREAQATSGASGEWQ